MESSPSYTTWSPCSSNGRYYERGREGDRKRKKEGERGRMMESEGGRGRATKQCRCNETVTYTTHGEFTFLHNLEPLLKRWQVL
jgi:hypothetical protein